jgi:hypothetical protein
VRPASHCSRRAKRAPSQRVIGGVPVSTRIEVDLGPDGRITEARLATVDPALAPKAQPIARERALQIASLASAAKAGVAGAEVELDDYPGLHYKPAALGQPLKLQYGFDPLNDPPGRPASTA